ncbi:MAG: hypothetical protein AVDCRST_MAG85-1253, partial [uncultured Solirubrobacteraceae bacterium]
GSNVRTGEKRDRPPPRNPPPRARPAVRARPSRHVRDRPGARCRGRLPVHAPDAMGPAADQHRLLGAAARRALGRGRVPAMRRGAGGRGAPRPAIRPRLLVEHDGARPRPAAGPRRHEARDGAGSSRGARDADPVLEGDAPRGVLAEPRADGHPRPPPATGCAGPAGDGREQPAQGRGLPAAPRAPRPAAARRGREHAGRALAIQPAALAQRVRAGRLRGGGRDRRPRHVGVRLRARRDKAAARGCRRVVGDRVRGTSSRRPVAVRALPDGGCAANGRRTRAGPL